MIGLKKPPYKPTPKEQIKSKYSKEEYFTNRENKRNNENNFRQMCLVTRYYESKTQKWSWQAILFTTSLYSTITFIRFCFVTAEDMFS